MAARSCPPTRTDPAVGVSSTTRMFTSVDLPLPDAPTRAVSSRRSTMRSRPCSACTSMPSAWYMRTSRSQTISASASDSVCPPCRASECSSASEASAMESLNFSSLCPQGHRDAAAPRPDLVGERDDGDYEEPCQREQERREVWAQRHRRLGLGERRQVNRRGHEPRQGDGARDGRYSRGGDRREHLKYREPDALPFIKPHRGQLRHCQLPVRGGECQLKQHYG